MDIVVITAVVAALFLIIAIAEPLAARLRLPYSVILALIGVLIAVGAAFFLRTNLTDALNPVATAVLTLPIRSNVFIYVLLPTLLFQVTLGVNLRQLIDDWAPVLLLAIVAVLVATLTVGYALYYVSGFSLVACLLLGSIVSTTDPSAVVGIFRNIAAPRRLSRIIEGESLLNDAAAIALFGVFIVLVQTGASEPDLGEALMRFPYLIVGGAASGIAIGYVGVRLMGMMGRHELAQISASLSLPYLSYLAAAELADASGVVAVVASGLVLNMMGPGRLPPEAWRNLRDVWDLLEHWAGAMIFILAALLIPKLLDGVTFRDIGLILVVAGAAILARAVIVFGLMPLLSWVKLSPPVSSAYRVAILWGGLRGAVTLALALAVTESYFVPDDVKRFIGILATGFALFTLIIQGISLRAVIGWLGLEKLSPLNSALAKQVVAVALQTVREDVAETTENYGLPRETVRSEAKRFAERLDTAVEAAEEANIPDRDRITLGLIAMAGAERDLIMERFHERAISSRLADRIVADADRLIETTRLHGRTGYRRAAKESLGYGFWFRFAVFMHNRFHLRGRLARASADQFERLLTQRLIMRDVKSFIDLRIRRIHGRRVAEILEDLLESRMEGVERAIEGQRLQFPGYAEELERRFIRRTALRLEEGEYDALKDDGLIGAELHATLLKELQLNRARLERRPRLDIAAQRGDLVRQFPLFRELDGTALRRLRSAMKTEFFAPGELIMRKDAPPTAVWFIASGAVELEMADRMERLGRGEMFGQISVLSRHRRRFDARAMTYCTLFRLDNERFLRLFRRSAAVRDAVQEAAAKRGITLDNLMEPAETAQPVKKKPAPAEISPAKAAETETGT